MITTKIKDFICLIDDEDFILCSMYTWFISTNGYLTRSEQINNKKRAFYFHREILTETPLTRFDHVDHINCNKLDNRKINLRICDQRRNKMNGRAHKDNKSGYKGVCLDKRTQKWLAHIGIDGKQTHIGTFYNKIDAAVAYNNAAVKHFGSFANLNIIE